MEHRRVLPLVSSFAIALLVLCGCDQRSGKKPLSHEAPAASGQENANQIVTRIARYRGWTKLTDQTRWAPELCSAPANPSQPSVRFSRSRDESTHGRKLYHLYSNDAPAYRAATTEPRIAAPIGLTIVKEAHSAIEVSGHAPAETATVTRDGRTFTPGPITALFVMTRVADQASAAWTYATVDPDAMTVLTAGAISSCIKCHADAPHDGLFGLE
jgi:hypothetical protein